MGFEPRHVAPVCVWDPVAITGAVSGPGGGHPTLGGRRTMAGRQTAEMDFYPRELREISVADGEGAAGRVQRKSFSYEYY